MAVYIARNIVLDQSFQQFLACVQSSPRASLVNLYLSEEICNSTEGLTLRDFLYMHTLNCQEKSDEFKESSKRMASECDITSERYREP